MVHGGAHAESVARGTAAARWGRPANPLSSGSPSGRFARQQHSSIARQPSGVVQAKVQGVVSTAWPLHMPCASPRAPYGSLPALRTECTSA